MHIASFRSSPVASCTALVTLAALLAGCGGGDADAAASGASVQAAAVAPLPDAETATVADMVALGKRTSTTPATTTTTTTTTTAAATTATTAADCGIAGFQAAVLARVNQWRAAGASCRTAGSFAPTTALTWNAKLQQAAAGHSQDMVARNFFSHTSYDGRTMSSRIDAVGYNWLSIGENIAAGYPTVIAVVDGWMASDGHCKNLMNPNFKEVGVACVPGTAANPYTPYWTMDLGKPA